MTATTPLPSPGTVAEHAVLDLKERLSGLEFETAKDVAAFANALGGTLLIGAVDNGASQVSAYRPLTAAEADDSEARIAQAIQNRCRPQPLVDNVRVPCANGWVLAVNVWPLITAPVGVHIQGNRADGFGGDAFAFPIRLANQTSWMSSERLPMHMLPELRRILILLRSIPEGDVVAIARRGADLQLHTIKSIDEMTNTVQFHSHPTPKGNSERWEPLDCIISVFQRRATATDPARWQIGLRDPY